MNALEMARNAYQERTAPIRTERGTEHDAFARVTHRLKTSDPSRSLTGYVQALHDNRRLWTLLAADVADGENRLPQSLRAQIFYLAEFTDLHTSRVLRREADLSVLIEINTAVMRGLRDGAAP